jgi:hypothetical protein
VGGMNKKISFSIALILFLIHFNSCRKDQTLQEQGFSLQKEFEIGVLEGDENYIFGSINDVKIDSYGNIYTLDTKMTQISKFNKQGGFILKFGKKGGGPGEFGTIESMALDTKNNIYVLDSPKVNVFNERGGFVRTFKLSSLGIDISIDMEGNLIILGPRNDTIFHKYDKQGTYLYSFGSPFKLPDEFAEFRQAQMFRLPLRVWIIKEQIYVMNPYKYEIHIYENAKLKAEISKPTPNYLRPEFKQHESGGFAGFVSDNLIHRIDDKLFVFYNGNKANWLDIYENDNLLKSLEVKGILCAIDDDGKFYFAKEDDYPKLVVYRMKGE